MPKKSDIPAWLDPSTLIMFRPKPRQVAFRQVAREQVDAGFCFRAQWLAASYDCVEFRREALSQGEWEEWSNDVRFVRWFYSEFPESSPLTGPELKLLDYQWWSGVSEGMRRGDQVVREGSTGDGQGSWPYSDGESGGAQAPRGCSVGGSECMGWDADRGIGAGRCPRCCPRLSRLPSSGSCLVYRS